MKDNTSLKREKIIPNYEALDRLLSQKERVYKGDFYKALVGNVGTLDFGISLAFCDLDIDEKGMEKIYQVVKRMKDRYTSPNSCPDYPEYYGPSFKKIDEAYSSGDIKRFKDSLDYLLSCIVCE